MKRENVTQLVYDYNDMESLKNMPCEEASNILLDSYEEYISSDYIFPSENKKFSKEEYNKYKIQCAFDVTYRALNIVGKTYRED